MSTAAGAIVSAPVVRSCRSLSQALEIHVYASGLPRRSAGDRKRAQINFHPGYRVYLRAQPGVFDRNTVLPAAGERSKKTLLAVRSMDRVANPDNASSLSPPRCSARPRSARSQAGRLSAGPAFATRPDFHGKSTYTIDTPVDTTEGGRPTRSFSIVPATGRCSTRLSPSPRRCGASMPICRRADDDQWFTTRWNELGQCAAGCRWQLHEPWRLWISRARQERPADRIGERSEKADKLRQAMRAPYSAGERPVIYEHARSGYQTRRGSPSYVTRTTSFLPRRSRLRPSPCRDPLHRRGAPSCASPTTASMVPAERLLLCRGRDQRYRHDERPQRGRRPGSTRERQAAAGAGGPLRSIPDRRLRRRDRRADTRVVVRVNPFPRARTFRKSRFTAPTYAQAALNVRLMSEVGAFAADEDPSIPLPTWMPLLRDADLLSRRGAPRDRERAWRTRERSFAAVKVALANVVDVNRPAAPELVATAGAQTATELRDVILTGRGQPRTRRTSSSSATAEACGRSLRTEIERSGHAIPPRRRLRRLPETAVLAKIDEQGSAIFHPFQMRIVNASGMLGENVSEVIL